MTPEKRAELTKQVLDANLYNGENLPDWALLGVYWTRDGKPIATLETDARGDIFTTNFTLKPQKDQYTDVRGRVHVMARDAKHKACKKCGMLVEWRQNKAGKWYLAEPKRTKGYHLCLPAWQAWYELQKDAIARTTEKLAEQGLKVTAETLGEAVDPTKETV